MKMEMMFAAGLLAAATAALAAAALEGEYDEAGGGKLDFAEDGVLHVSPPAVEPFDAAYAVEGDTVTITTPADATSECAGVTGTYTFVETDGSVAFTLVADDCAPRAAGLTAGAWTQAPAAPAE